MAAVRAPGESVHCLALASTAGTRRSGPDNDVASTTRPDASVVTLTTPLPATRAARASSGYAKSTKAVGRSLGHEPCVASWGGANATHSAITHSSTAMSAPLRSSAPSGPLDHLLAVPDDQIRVVLAQSS